MNVMVTGAAGYIGSHAVKRLLAEGHHVVAVDNLQRGHRRAVEFAGGEAGTGAARRGAPEASSNAANNSAAFHQLDLHQTDELARLMRDQRIEAVMHFAALAYVGESVRKPLDYYQNNTAGSLSLLRAVDQAGVGRLVFSSTCATYGQPAAEHIPITEQTPQHPINPYGWSKLMTERALIDYAKANEDFSFAALRYFNVCGSARDGAIGEDHDPETHLIPVLLNVALGKGDHATIFGDDYDTPDGTCVRDYIHVEDLIDAHVTVMQSLAHAPSKNDPPSSRTAATAGGPKAEGEAAGHRGRVFNLGTGQGNTVRQIVDAVREVTGADIPVEMGPRRPGDPPTLYADPSKIERELGWSAQHTDIRTAVADAWRWFQAHPDGYA